VPRRQALLRLPHRVQPPFLALARRRSREPPPSLLLPVKDAVALCRTPLPGSPPMSRSCAAARLYSEVPVVRRRHPTSSPSSRIPWMWPPPPVKEVLPSHLPAGRGRRRTLSCAAAALYRAPPPSSPLTSPSCAAALPRAGPALESLRRGCHRRSRTLLTSLLPPVEDGRGRQHRRHFFLIEQNLYAVRPGRAHPAKN
jgi:hypothetical protein